MTKVVTFYSYKGGVGRTMALVNVAHVLARDGWRVLMVDFDLEAPGMTHFFAEQVRNRPETVKHDALDLLLHAKGTIGWDLTEKKSKPLEIPKSLAEYIVNIPLPDKWKDKVIPYRSGRLDLLPATLDPVEREDAPEAEPSRNYLRRMDELDLQGVFDVGGPRHWFGNHVRQYFVNARFKATGDLLFTLRKTVWAAYDLVLVDSRTGLNEVAGLCIGPLCDALVICCGLNDQSIYGTKYFMKKAGLFDRDKAKPYTLVAGPVPPWHTREADERIGLLSRELRAGPVVEVPYHPAAALVEKTFVLDERKEPITHAYERLAPVVAGLAEPGKERPLDLRGIRLLLQAREQGLGGAELNQQVARRLSVCRLAEELRRFWPFGLLASFPTAASVASLPTREVPTETGRGWDLVPFAAAVSAYRMHSDRPFRRAWKLLPHCALKKEREHLGVRLVFMQLRVVGTSPDREVAYGLIKSACDNVNAMSKSEAIYFAEPERITDQLMTMRSLAGREVPWSPEGADGALNEWERLLEGTLDHQAQHWFRSPGWYMVEQSGGGLSGELVLRSAAALAKKAPRREGLADLERLVHAVRLSERFREMANVPQDSRWQMIRDRIMDGMMFEEMYKGGTWFQMPLGFWPEPLMASAVALVKGPEAVEEVIGWLMLAKLVHGYAWRVLVDWRHLESVKDHPLFVEFIRQEDELVNEIESAIDRGDYTL